MSGNFCHMKQLDIVNWALFSSTSLEDASLQSSQVSSKTVFQDMFKMLDWEKHQREMCAV